MATGSREQQIEQISRGGQQVPIRKQNYDFQQESQFYVDVLTKELCEVNEEGTFVIVSDGGDELSSGGSDDELDGLDADDGTLEGLNVDDSIRNQIEAPMPMQVAAKDSQINQTQGKQQSPKQEMSQLQMGTEANQSFEVLRVSDSENSQQIVNNLDGPLFES